jgi:hypothetical protein
MVRRFVMSTMIVSANRYVPFWRQTPTLAYWDSSVLVASGISHCLPDPAYGIHKVEYSAIPFTAHVELHDASTILVLRLIE